MKNTGLSISSTMSTTCRRTSNAVLRHVRWRMQVQSTIHAAEPCSCVLALFMINLVIPKLGHYCSIKLCKTYDICKYFDSDDLPYSRIGCIGYWIENEGYVGATPTFELTRPMNGGYIISLPWLRHGLSKWSDVKFHSAYIFTDRVSSLRDNILVINRPLS